MLPAPASPGDVPRLPAFPNLHQIELFYYVAVSGGISRAVRGMPYGLQQPAISRQLSALEKSLGVRLCVHRPFQLTQAGRRLFETIEPLLAKLGTVGQWLTGAEAPVVRIGASEFIHREYVPKVVERLQERDARVQVTLRQGSQPSLLAALEQGELDVVIAALGQTPVGCARLPVVELPLVLLAPKGLRLPHPEKLWRAGSPDIRWVAPPSSEGICHLFLDGLRRRGVSWTPFMEASSTALVTNYVAGGHGVGVSLDLPVLVQHPRVRKIPLAGFAPAEVAAIWREPAGEPLRLLLSVIADRAKELWPEGTVRA